MKRIALIRIRGSVKVKKEVEDTMKLLKLYNKHTCVIVGSSKTVIGMIKKIKDHITWGELNEETFKQLLEKRGRLAGKQRLSESYLKEKTKLGINEFVKEFFEFKKELKDIPGLKTFFKLCSPQGGFERKGIKTPFSMGGVLGYRKEKINDLIIRML